MLTLGLTYQILTSNFNYLKNLLSSEDSISSKWGFEFNTFSFLLKVYSTINILALFEVMRKCTPNDLKLSNSSENNLRLSHR